MGLCSENAASAGFIDVLILYSVFTHSKTAWYYYFHDKISWNHYWICELSLTKVIQQTNMLVITLIGYKISSWRISFCCRNLQNGQWILSSKKKKTLSESNQMDIWHSVSQFWRGYTEYSNICLKPKQFCVFT